MCSAEGPVCLFLASLRSCIIADSRSSRSPPFRQHSPNQHTKTASSTFSSLFRTTTLSNLLEYNSRPRCVFPSSEVTRGRETLTLRVIADLPRQHQHTRRHCESILRANIDDSELTIWVYSAVRLVSQRLRRPSNRSTPSWLDAAMPRGTNVLLSLHSGHLEEPMVTSTVDRQGPPFHLLPPCRSQSS